jgi:hypothetical protein
MHINSPLLQNTRSNINNTKAKYKHALCNDSKAELLPDALQAREYDQSSSNYAALA